MIQINESFSTAEYFSNISAESQTFRYLGITIGLIDIMVGAPGNFITIFAVLRNKSLGRNPFNLFIANLCAIDLLTSLIMMPFNVTGYLLMRWPYGTATCILQAFSYFSCGYTSIVCLVAITLNRLMGIASPAEYRFFSKRSVKVLLVLCWLVAPIFLLPYLVVSLHGLVVDDPGSLFIGWKEEQLLCTFVNIRGSWLVYMQFLRFLFQFFPCLLMMICYIIMYYFIRQSNKRRKANALRYYDAKNRHNNRADQVTEYTSLEARSKSENNRFSINETSEWRKVYVVTDGKIEVHYAKPPPLMKRKFSLVREIREQEIHLFRVSIIVCGIFSFLFLPSFIINILPGSSLFDSRIHMAASNITWLNSCVNPFIYALLHKPMRKEYKAVLLQMYAYVMKICKIPRRGAGSQSQV